MMSASAIPNKVAASTDLIALDAVSRTYPRGRVTALRDVNFSIGRGEHVAITGPSGSGKSTLLYLAGGLDQPTSGRVFFEGREPRTPANWTRLRQTRIGIVFQSFQLVAGLTAAENVEMPMFGVVRQERDRRKRVTALLDRVGLGHRADHRITELSGGESQRVAIARSLANSPDVILADEPTGNLDSQNSSGVLDLLEDLHRRECIALVIVTHDPGVSARAQRTVRLLDGQIVSQQLNGNQS
jgi:putative ABC transport system ATP-binding protein